ncbi:calsyntenin-1 isoform X2 [Sceloporus undulatus]|uniref:calsyntenin-1 isoform X2 n=1 Tax=Sceloporus undulatus TaxID=8520 RepID=UPI001C4DD1A6|nr:calsyntenin-1 isoform X2 [Sceloporus undulatus]
MLLPSPLAPAWILLAALLLLSGAARVNKHKPWIETTYHGIVTENDNTVLLDPPLIALDKDAPLRFAGEICGFKIHGQNVPFEAVVVDKSTGEGMIRSKEKLDCELQKDYTFTIQAYDCGKGPDGANMKKSHKATVHIQVNDVNEYAPVFKEKSYKATVIEGKRYDNVLKVEAVDADCSPQFSQICSYEIVTPDVPFTIDKDGYIKNSEKLNYGKEHQYKLTVTAYDCGKKRATEDVLVKITIKPTCKPGWQGWSKRMEYEPGTGALSLFPNIHLETCDEPITSVQATIELETNHIGKGCDRDTYAEKSLHRLCGASSGTAELLPPPSNMANWTIGLPTDNGHDSDQVFEFNGTQAVKIPDSVVIVNMKEPFVISVWMRHGPGSREKEAILCNSDKTDMNRHHYSLYVHNCRLVFLFRQDPSEGQSYKPAEFHWKLNQVCDKEWHHYILNIEFPTVSLYVDGVSFDPFPVTEDYPLHPSKIESQLVVGACWQEYAGNENDTEKATESPAGGELRMAQYFRGNLAGLMIRSGKLENKKVIDCLYTCKEGLDLQMADGVGKGLKIHMNPSQSTLSLEGDDIDRFDKAMQHISYLNSRQFPTPGIRRIKITSTVKCSNDEACIAIPFVDGYIMVLQPEEPKISLSGINHFARSASEFESPEGVSLFPELRIISTITREVEPEGDGDEDPTVQESLVSEEIMHNLDTCEVTVVGEELNQEQESLEVDMVRLQQKGMEMSSSNLGLIITGVDTMASYEEVLHLIRYRNWHAVSLFDRKFKLVCSELNGRYVSNEFKVEVNVIHTANPMDHASHIAAQQPQFVQPIHHSFVDLSGHNLANPHPGFSVVPSTATVVIVVCVSFLVFMIILGVFRIRAAHQRTMRDQDSGKENEMDWDDSALTITVNPMETYEDQHSSEEEEEEEEESEDGEEEDDITSAESESSEEEEGEQEDQQNVNRQQQLEWDDSTLTY